jgi:hypothetical protein
MLSVFEDTSHQTNHKSSPQYEAKVMKCCSGCSVSEATHPTHTHTQSKKFADEIAATAAQKVRTCTKAKVVLDVEVHFDSL